MDLTQIVIGLILLVVFFGVLKFVARVLAWGLIVFVGIPFLFSGPVAGVDWSEVTDDVLDRASQALGAMSAIIAEQGNDRDTAAAPDVRVTVRENDDRCGPAAPLRLGIWNDASRDVGEVSFVVTHANGGAPEVVIHDTFGGIIPAGKSWGTCIARPASVRPGARLAGEATAARFLSRT